MKKTLLCVLFGLMGCFFLGACGKPPIPDPENIIQPSQVLFDGLDTLNPAGIAKQQNQLGQERYFVVLDDGLGMKGFVSTYCQSYRTAITAISGVSMSSESTYVRASDLISEYATGAVATKNVFQEAANEQFFKDKSNDAASVIEAMTEEYNNHPDQVMILVSDMMIPTEDDCNDAAKALQEAVITRDHATVGIIGIQGDFRGTIENLPISPTTGYKRKISDYMVIDKDEYGNYKHPLYLLFFGNDQAVLNAMEKTMNSLRKSAIFDMDNEVKALYLSEYDIARRDKDDIITKFNLGYQGYNDADYPAYFMIRGVKDEAGKINFESKTAIPEKYQQMLNDLPIAKLYALERGNSEKNVKIRCTVPYTLIDSSVNGATISDSSNLLIPAQNLKLKPEDYVISTDIQVLDCTDAQAKAWVDADATMIYCEGAEIDASCKRVDVVLTVDTSLLDKDEPLLCKVTVHIAAKPKWEAIEALYNTEWVENWTLNLKAFDKESISLGQMETSARFTAATTARTPFLYNLIHYGLAEEQMKQVDQNIREQTEACTQVTMFGVVVRDVPIKYNGEYAWEYDEDFGGWAFSEEQAENIRAAID